MVGERQNSWCSAPGAGRGNVIVGTCRAAEVLAVDFCEKGRGFRRSGARWWERNVVTGVATGFRRFVSETRGVSVMAGGHRGTSRYLPK